MYCVFLFFPPSVNKSDEPLAAEFTPFDSYLTMESTVSLIVDHVTTITLVFSVGFPKVQ